MRALRVLAGDPIREAAQEMDYALELQVWYKKSYGLKPRHVKKLQLDTAFVDQPALSKDIGADFTAGYAMTYDATPREAAQEFDRLRGILFDLLGLGSPLVGYWMAMHNVTTDETEKWVASNPSVNKAMGKNRVLSNDQLKKDGVI